MAPYPPGPLITLSGAELQVDIAPQAGGRIAQITRGGVEQLAGFGASSTAMIGWGCYPMLPYAGRVRDGRFDFGGRRYQLPLNMGLHAIHGVGFGLPWQVQLHTSQVAELSLELPRNNDWPFGGTAHQRIELDASRLRLRLSMTAGEQAMPATIGWHPWFRKPDRLRFTPTAMYPRDPEGIATLPLAKPAPGPWDDCFLNSDAIALETQGERLRLSSDCVHWVVYDENPDATCVEPQSGPPDAFNIEPETLQAGQTLGRWFEMAWDDC